MEVRTPYYFEYPSLVVMLIKEIKYGIFTGLKKIEIDPFGLANKDFTYNIGNLKV